MVTNQNVGWALYFVDPADAQPTTVGGTAYPNFAADGSPAGLSGNCANLQQGKIFDPVTRTLRGWYGRSGNGWSTITVPSFEKPTNYYLAMWMEDSHVTTFPNSMNLVYKSRYAIGKFIK